MKVFIDTGAFIAYLDEGDQHHDIALQRYHFYRQQKTLLITSNYILDELFTWFGQKRNQRITEKIILRLQRSIEHGQLRLLYVDAATCREAEERFLKFYEHRISFTDATTYVLYKEFKLDEIFTFDRAFRKIRASVAP